MQTSIQNNVIDPPDLGTDLERLISKNLPPVPGNINRVLELLRDENSSVNQITEAICYEPSLVARILKLANSPVYALERKVTSIQMAINAIGIKTLQDIIMLEFTSATFGKSIKASNLAKDIWEHSLAVAMLSRELSNILQMRGAEEAFSCGLLHDIGKLIFLNDDAAGYLKMLYEPDENKVLTAEESQYGFTHATVGAVAVREWGMPYEISYAILHHHTSSETSRQSVVAYLVDLANIVATIKGYGLRKGYEMEIERSHPAMKLKVTSEQIDQAWDAVKDHIQLVVDTFR